MPPVLTFDRGTLLLEGLPEEEVPPAFVYDDRVHLHRAPAMAYHDAVWALHRRKQPWEDRARAYGVLERPHRTWRQPRHYQEEALAAWNAAIYVAQIEDQRLDSVVKDGSYIEATRDVLHRNNGLWFLDESYVISRRRG